MPAARSVLTAAITVAVTASCAPRTTATEWVGRESTIPDLPIPTSLDAAEAEGAAHPREVGDPVRAHVFAAHPESIERKCVVAADAPANPIVTGDFSTGTGSAAKEAGRRFKISWLPRHDPGPGRDGLLLRAARIDSGASARDTVRAVNLTWGAPIGTDRPVFFFPTYMTLPTPGEWLVVATSGPSWGCVIIDVVAGRGWISPGR